MAKALAISLAPVMDGLVLDVQTVAVRGKHIQDSVLATNELLDNQIKTKKPGVVF